MIDSGLLKIRSGYLCAQGSHRHRMYPNMCPQSPIRQSMASGSFGYRMMNRTLSTTMKTLLMGWHLSEIQATPNRGFTVRQPFTYLKTKVDVDFSAGPSSNIAFLRHLSRATSATLKTFEGCTLAPDQRPTQSLLSRAPSPINTPSTTGPLERYQTDPLVLPSEAQTHRLLELFFNETGLLFPFIQKEYIVSTYNHARSRGMVGIRKTFLCLLHAILAMAAHLDDDHTVNPGDAETFYQRAHAIQSSLDFRMTNVEIGKYISHLGRNLAS